MSGDTRGHAPQITQRYTKHPDEGGLQHELICARCGWRVIDLPGVGYVHEGVGPAADEEHDCWANAVPYTSDGPLGHGWECGVCGEFLQAG